MAQPTTSRSVITITTGEAGSGKSYVRCARYLCDVFLPEHTGIHFSNFPLGEVPENHSNPPTYEGETFRDRIAQRVSKRTKVEADELKARIQVIPKEVLDSWEAGTSGPWDYFDGSPGRSLNNAHVAIDEVHNFIGPDAKASFRKHWMQWLGEIRHQGATVEFISQNRGKVPIEIRREAGFWLHLKNTETERDPFFKIELGDWYELGASWLWREYRAKFVEEERREVTGATRKADARRIYPIEPEYFTLYDSYSAPQKGGTKGAARKRVWQTRSRVGVLLWFLRRNTLRILPKLALVAFFVWLFMGGGRWLIGAALERGKTYLSPAPIPIETTPVTSPDSTSDTVSTPIPALPPALQAEIDAQKAELESLRAKLKEANRIYSIGLDSVTLKDGRTYKYGEPIELGPLKGRRISRIDRARRLVVLDDGTVLELPRVRGGDSADAGK